MMSPLHTLVQLSMMQRMIPSVQPSGVMMPTGNCISLNFSRTRVTLTSYSDEAIRTAVETWADSVPALA